MASSRSPCGPSLLQLAAKTRVQAVRGRRRAHHHDGGPRQLAHRHARRAGPVQGLQFGTLAAANHPLTGVPCLRVWTAQTAIADGNGSQCGFCTPGWVMQMYSLLDGNAAPSAAEARHTADTQLQPLWRIPTAAVSEHVFGCVQVGQHFDGNLCRCTGYRPILAAFGKFAKGGSMCGKVRANPPTQTWTTLHKHGPNSLGLRRNALPEHQMARITPGGCVPFSTTSCPTRRPCWNTSPRRCTTPTLRPRRSTTSR